VGKETGDSLSLGQRAMSASSFHERSSTAGFLFLGGLKLFLHREDEATPTMEGTVAFRFGVNSFSCPWIDLG
jgi:hypothetical protein